MELHTYLMVKDISPLVAADDDVIVAAEGTDPQTGSTYHLIKDRRPSDGDYGTGSVATPLTDEEAADARLSHLFNNYDLITDLDTRVRSIEPMILRDELLLTGIRRDAIGFFYAKDQSTMERADALARYASALSMATAGSIEGCLEAISIVVPGDADEAAFITLIATRLLGHLAKFPRVHHV